MTFDFRWADFGHFGAFVGVRRVSGDPEREPYDRATIGAAGPVMAGVSLDHPSAAVDRRAIDLNVTDGWNLETWRWLAFERARDLARHEPFRSLWKRFVLALGNLGEQHLELRGAEVDRFLARTPHADLRPGRRTPPPSVPTS